jgi:hypothetical protein
VPIGSVFTPRLVRPPPSLLASRPSTHRTRIVGTPLLAPPRARGSDPLFLPLLQLKGVSTPPTTPFPPALLKSCHRLPPPPVTPATVLKLQISRHPHRNTSRRRLPLPLPPLPFSASSWSYLSAFTPPSSIHGAVCPPSPTGVCRASPDIAKPSPHCLLPLPLHRRITSVIPHPICHVQCAPHYLLVPTLSAPLQHAHQ